MTTINPLSYDLWYCTKCKCSFVVPVEDKNNHLLKKGMRCPNAIECKGKISPKDWGKVAFGRLENFQRVSAVELFQASAGVGLPKERNCRPDDIRKLLMGARIVNVHLSPATDPKKSLLFSLTVESGKTIHVATSTSGPIVYKVTENE
jgi:hypothetical protein